MLCEGFYENELKRVVITSVNNILYKGVMLTTPVYTPFFADKEMLIYLIGKDCDVYEVKPSGNTKQLTIENFLDCAYDVGIVDTPDCIADMIIAG